MDGLPPEARRAAEGAAAAIDVGLGDAREAVATLRSPAHADTGFCSLVRRAVEDHGDRFGLRVEFTFEGDHTTHIAPRTQAEILRIVQEALTNVARHANATVVGVRLAISDDRITLRVADNGHGFDVASVGPDELSASRRCGSGPRSSAAGSGSPPRAETGTLVILTAPFSATRRPLVRGGASDDRAGPRDPGDGGRRPPARPLGGGEGDRRRRHGRRRRGLDGGGGARRSRPQVAPDILLLDIALPGMSGVELVRELAPRLPNTRIVMLTVSSADRDVADAMRYGASGYLTKDLSPEALARSLRATQTGELVMPRRLAARLLARLLRRGAGGRDGRGRCPSTA